MESLERIIYLDETGLDKFIYRPYAKARKGVRVFASIPGRRYLRQSVISARTPTHDLLAPFIYSGTANEEFIYWWLSEILPPNLKPASILIWDNAPIHNSQRIKDLITKHNHQLIFLPAYSPDLNPIEKKWSQLKHNLAKYYQQGKDFLEHLIDEVNRLTISEWV